MSAPQKPPANSKPQTRVRHLADASPDPARDDGRFMPNEQLYDRPYGGRSGAYGRNEDYEVDRDKSAGGRGPAQKKASAKKSSRKKS